MDQTELTQFAVDYSLATANFLMTRIIELFERADVVDDAKDGKSKSGQKAGAGTKSDRSAVASATALTMQQSELTDLALDCSLATADFPMERVVQVFESADAVKDPAALKKGATADGNLELQEFLDVVVKLAFHCANPEFGKKGTSPWTSSRRPCPSAWSPCSRTTCCSTRSATRPRRRRSSSSQHNCERLFSHFSSRGDTSTGATAFLFERSSPAVVVLPPRVQISIK
jgi:hypothetical protein